MSDRNLSQPLHLLFGIECHLCMEQQQQQLQQLEVQCYDSYAPVNWCECVASARRATYQKSLLYFIKQWNLISISSCALLIISAAGICFA